MYEVNTSFCECVCNGGQALPNVHSIVNVEGGLQLAKGRFLREIEGIDRDSSVIIVESDFFGDFSDD